MIRIILQILLFWKIRDRLYEIRNIWEQSQNQALFYTFESRLFVTFDVETEYLKQKMPATQFYVFSVESGILKGLLNLNNICLKLKESSSNSQCIINFRLSKFKSFKTHKKLLYDSLLSNFFKRISLILFKLHSINNNHKSYF